MSKQFLYVTTTDGEIILNKDKIVKVEAIADSIILLLENGNAYRCRMTDLASIEKELNG